LRSFLSYDIEDASLLTKIAKFEEELKSTGSDLKLVRPDILHFTVRFLGEISEPQSEEIIRVLEGQFSPLNIEVKFKGLGTFPNDKKISVIWIASEESSARIISEQVRKINTRLEKQLPSILSEESDRFNPHVTIARVKSGRNKDQLVNFLAEHKDEDFGTSIITNLKLKKSVLHPEGPEYSDVYVFR
jgi:RNA 2',3'-cyclic 3'-phosphodiesterase